MGSPKKKLKDMTKDELEVELERRQIKKRKHFKRGKTFASVGGKIAGAGALTAAALGGCDPLNLKKSPGCIALGIGAGTGAVVTGAGAGLGAAGYLQKRKTKKIQKLLDKQPSRCSKAYHRRQYKKAQNRQRRVKLASRRKSRYRKKKRKGSKGSRRRRKGSKRKRRY